MSEPERDVVDRQEATQLPDDNPNVAAGTGDHNHEDHIGGDAADDEGVAEAGQALDAEATGDQGPAER